MDRQVSNNMMQQMLVGQLLDELEKSGVNVAELRELYEKGQHSDAFRESLIKLYQAHKLASWICR